MDKYKLLLFCLVMLTTSGMVIAGTLSGSIGGGGGDHGSGLGEGSAGSSGKPGVKVNLTTNYTPPTPRASCYEINGTLCQAGEYCMGGEFTFNVSEPMLCCLNGTCTIPPSCIDGIQNQCEEGVDCGGPCRPCYSDNLGIVLITRNITTGKAFTLEVVDSKGNPVESARLSYGGTTGYTDETGQIRLIAEPGVMEIRATKPNFAPASIYVGSCPEVSTIVERGICNGQQNQTCDNFLGLLLGVLLIVSILINLFLLFGPWGVIGGRYRKITK